MARSEARSCTAETRIARNFIYVRRFFFNLIGTIQIESGSVFEGFALYNIAKNIDFIVKNSIHSLFIPFSVDLQRYYSPGSDNFDLPVFLIRNG